MEVGGDYKPIDPLRVSLNYTKSRLRRNDTGQVAFDTNIFSLRSTYQFTRFLFTRLRVDYDTLSANTSGQLLFGWNPNPGTAFYVGYNDNFNFKGYSPFQINSSRVLNATAGRFLSALHIFSARVFELVPS